VVTRGRCGFAVETLSPSLRRRRETTLSKTLKPSRASAAWASLGQVGAALKTATTRGGPAGNWVGEARGQAPDLPFLGLVAMSFSKAAAAGHQIHQASIGTQHLKFAAHGRQAACRRRPRRPAAGSRTSRRRRVRAVMSRCPGRSTAASFGRPVMNNHRAGLMA